MILGAGRLALRWLAALSLLLAPALHAQEPVRALDRAIAAYRNLDLDAAAAQLAALTSAPNAARLPDAALSRALMYLGATEVLRERPDSASAAFRRLLLHDPAYRPDPLVFPPEVTSRFDVARRDVRAVAVVVPGSAELSEATDAIALRLHASTPHTVRAMVVDATGTPVRLLHDGEVGDTLLLRWTGRDALGRFHPSGSYRLEVTSIAGTGVDNRARVVVVPLRLERLEPDTLALAAVPTFVPRPETRPGETRLRPLIAGLLGVGAVVALPSLMGDGIDGVGTRHVVAGGLAVGGILGVVLSRRPQPVPENIAWNAEQRMNIDRELARRRTTNDARRDEVRLRIVAGRPVIEERP